MAIAPMPVAHPGPDRKRWRVILQFYDYSILAYELSRGEEVKRSAF